MASEIRRLYCTVALQDAFSPGLKRVNTLMNSTKAGMSKLPAATQAAFAGSSPLVQRLATGWGELRTRALAYASGLTERLPALSAKLKEHQLQLAAVGAALSGVVALTLKGAVAEEKHRRNVASLAGVIDYQHEGQEKVNAALQDYITLAEAQGYISKEQRARLVSELITMRASKDTILAYGETLEKLGVAQGKTVEEVISAMHSSLAGMHRGFRNLGVSLEEADITAKMHEIRRAHKGWSEEAIRAEAVMQVALPQMTAVIGDFGTAVDSAYGDTVRFKAKLSDLTGDIGAVYIPAFRGAIDVLLRFTQFLNAHPVLKMAFAVTTLSGAVLALSAVAFAHAIPALASLSGALLGMSVKTFLATVSQQGLAAALAGTRIAMLLTAGASKILAVGLWLVNAPLLPLIAVIAGVIAGALLLQHIWVHWGEISERLAGLLARLRGGLDTVITGVKSLTRFLPLLLGPIGAVWLAFKNWDKLTAIFKDAGSKLMHAFASGILGAIAAPVRAVMSVGERIRELLPFSDAARGPLSNLTLSGSRLLTTFTRGIELAAPKIPPVEHIFRGFAPPRPAPVTGAAAPSHAAAAPVTVNVGGITITGASDARAVGDEVIARLQREFLRLGVLAV